jgi:hypothetical protein
LFTFNLKNVKIENTKLLHVLCCLLFGDFFSPQHPKNNHRLRSFSCWWLNSSGPVPAWQTNPRPWVQNQYCPLPPPKEIFFIRCPAVSWLPYFIHWSGFIMG